MLELKILKLIYLSPNIQVKGILNTLNIPNSTATNAINRLVKKELLQRKLNNNDLRSFELELTAKGMSAVSEHLAAETAVFDNLLKCLSNEEKDNFVSLFKKIVSQI